MSIRHHLHLVADRRAAGRDLLDAVEAALRFGVDAVQLRDREASAGDLFRDALRIARLIRSHDARLIVNDRVDVAVAVRAHGVQLPARGLPAEAARTVLEPWQLVGVSVHSLEDARAAARAGADYVLFGHVFATPSHRDEPPRGVAALSEVVEAIDIPVLAIGGIDVARVPEVLRTGCAGVAVVSAILAADDPAGAARSLRDALDVVRAEPKRPFPERRD
jgi:thiamine-phosphate diphosphorylase